MLPAATRGNTSADAPPGDELERLAGRVTQLEEQCRWLRRRLRLRVAAPRRCWGSRPSPLPSARTSTRKRGPGEGRAAESLRVRRLAVVDANGVERVLIAVPLSPAGEG